MSNHTYRQPKAPFILIPLYIYPLRKGETWAPLFKAVRRYPDLSFVVIVNPDSGPGQGSAPDENYLAVLRTMIGFRNVTILGYVAVCWAEREFDEVARDIRAYYCWEKITHKGHDKHHRDKILTLRIDGIFFDEAPSKASEENVSYMSSVVKLARSMARSADRPWNTTVTYRREQNTKTDHLIDDTMSPGRQLPNQRGRAEHDDRQTQAPSSPCTIIYNPGTPPSHLSPFFDSSTQADYIVTFEQTLATWPTTRPESRNQLLEGQSFFSMQSILPSDSSSGSSSSSSSLSFSPRRSTSRSVLAPDLDPSSGTDQIQAPELEATDPSESEHKTGREYIACSLASLSPEERARSIAIAHSVTRLADQLRFAAEAVEYGLAGHFATSSGDYASWSGPSSSEGACLGSESNIFVSPDGGSLDEREAVDTAVDFSSHWMSYVEQADRLASRKLGARTNPS